MISRSAAVCSCNEPEPNHLFIRPRMRNLWLYLAECEGRHKVGITGHLKTRIQTLSRQQGATVNVLHRVDAVGAPLIEQALLKRMAVYAIGHEWFRLPPEEVALVCSLPEDICPCRWPDWVRLSAPLTPTPGSRSVTASLPKDLVNRLERLCGKTGRTLNDLLAEAVKRLLGGYH
jgi:hypothetical protein